MRCYEERPYVTELVYLFSSFRLEEVAKYISDLSYLAIPYHFSGLEAVINRNLWAQYLYFEQPRRSIYRTGVVAVFYGCNNPDIFDIMHSQGRLMTDDRHRSEVADET